VRGIPTFCTSDLAICWPVANRDLTKIESPELPDRTQWLNDLELTIEVGDHKEELKNQRLKFLLIHPQKKR
jgi:hypothetical protein